MRYTLWEFKSPSNPQIVRSMRYYDATDRQYQHEYQKILWQGEANGSQDAWFKCGFVQSEHDRTAA